MEITSVAILANPIAGNGRSRKLANWLVKELAERKIDSKIFTENWPSSFDEFTDIWLIGGDGTINYFINQYPDCKKPLALFKGGTGNDFAWKLYGDTSDAAQLNQILNSHPKPVDVGKCNDTLFLNCLGVGFDGEIIRHMKSIRFLGGSIGYLFAVIIKILSFHEYAFQITCGSEKWKDRYLLVMVTNSSRAGGGFFVAPDAMIDDGKLNMVLCKKLAVRKRLQYLPIIKKGKHLHLPFVIQRLGESFSIIVQSEIAIQIDGELLYAKELLIEVLAAKFYFRY